jgi:hypothetical protein
MNGLFFDGLIGRWVEGEEIVTWCTLKRDAKEKGER